MVESRCGAVAVGRACLFPPLSSGGALVARPWIAPALASPALVLEPQPPAQPHSHVGVERVIRLAGMPGISGSAEQDFYSTEAWHRIMAVNATGVFFGLKYAIPAMIASGLL